MGKTIYSPKSIETTFVDLLIADLDLAMTFLEMAHTTPIAENAQRNYRNAENTYGAVIEKLQAVTLTEEQQTLLERKLASLRSRLRGTMKPADRHST